MNDEKMVDDLPEEARQAGIYAPMAALFVDDPKRPCRELALSCEELIRELLVWRDQFGKPGTVAHKRVDLIVRDARAALAKLESEARS